MAAAVFRPPGARGGEARAIVREAEPEQSPRAPGPVADQLDPGPVDDGSSLEDIEAALEQAERAVSPRSFEVSPVLAGNITGFGSYASNGSGRVTREALMEQGFTSAQADVMMFQAHEEEVLQQYFMRWICAICVFTVAAIPVYLGLFIWLLIEYHASKQHNCEDGMILHAYVIGALVIFCVKTFNTQLIRCFCCWGPDPEARVPEVPPMRVKIYRSVLEVSIFAWHCFGLAISDCRTCRGAEQRVSLVNPFATTSSVPQVYTGLGLEDRDPFELQPACNEAWSKLSEASKVYAIFNIAVTIILLLNVVGLRRVLQIVYRHGLLPVSSAAPSGTLEASTEEVDAKALDEHMREHPGCPICMEDYKPGAKDVLKVKHCGHIFHAQCLKSWMNVNRTCPLCRYDLVTGHSDPDDRKEGDAAAVSSGNADAAPAGEMVN